MWERHSLWTRTEREEGNEHSKRDFSFLGLLLLELKFNKEATHIKGCGCILSWDWSGGTTMSSAPSAPQASPWIAKTRKKGRGEEKSNQPTEKINEKEEKEEVKVGRVQRRNVQEEKNLFPLQSSTETVLSCLQTELTSLSLSLSNRSHVSCTFQT